ncbi:hypothetical protein LTR17_006897 [Elasticomyces elasticus]|nr:hypothetical protein LTR17_006897 [Elasticomyces elasticus]
MAPTVSDTPVKFSLAAVSAQQKQGKAKRSAPNPLVEYHTAVPLTHWMHKMARDEEDPADVYEPSPPEARRHRIISPLQPFVERWMRASLGDHKPPFASEIDSLYLAPSMPHPAERPPPTCQLWRLPREIRDFVWTYALVEDRHLLAETTIRTPGRRPKYTLKKTRHEFKSHPQLPALTGVCKSIREETMTVFWSENIFRLRVGDPRTGYALSHYSKDANFRHVVLCFDIRYTVHGHDPAKSTQPAELEVKLKGDGTARFSCGSWLGKECACQLIRGMEAYVHKEQKSLKRTGLLRLALDFTSRLRSLYKRKTDRWADNWSEICDDCGKKIWNDGK